MGNSGRIFTGETVKVYTTTSLDKEFEKGRNGPFSYHNHLVKSFFCVARAQFLRLLQIL